MLVLIAQLLGLLLMARLCGVAAERLGQSAPVGELVAGVLIALAILIAGPSNDWLSGLQTSPEIGLLGTLAIFFLVLQVGVDMEPKEVFSASGGAFLVALGGVIVPFAFGMALAWWFIPDSDMKPAQAFVVGIAISVTAIPATARVFEELGLLHHRLSVLVLSAALIDDIIGLLLMAAVTTYVATGGDAGLGNLAWLTVKAIGFFLVTGLLGAHVYPHVSERLQQERAVALELSALVVIGLAYALLAEALGLHWIVGAFMAGLFCESARLGKRAYRDLKLTLAAICSGVLGPLFFISIGLQVDLRVVVEVPFLLLVVLSAAFLGKLIGAGLPALLLGYDRRHACAVGVGMSARGAVELIILGIVVEAGIFMPSAADGVVASLFSVLVIMAVVTTATTPVFLRALLRNDD